MSAPVWDGVPLNPERDGWHWLKHPEDLRPCPVGWDAMHSAWCGGGMHSSRGIIELGYTYLGPLILPADHAAAVEAAAQAERERLIGCCRAEMCRVRSMDHGPTDALTAALAKAREDVLREAAECQPCTAENPNETDYHRGYFDGVMAFGKAIRALARKEVGK